MVKHPCSFKAVVMGTLASSLCVSLSTTALAQDSSANLEVEYARLLQQIEDLKLSTAYKEVFIADQEKLMADMQGRIDNTEQFKTELRESFGKMVTAIETEYEADLPFLKDVRERRIGELRDRLEDEKTSPAVLWRTAINLYKIEVQYGQGLEVYQGDNPVNPSPKGVPASIDDEGRTIDAEGRVMNEDFYFLDEDGDPIYDGTYLRYGRVALMFMSSDESEFYRYDKASSDWNELESSRRNEVRQAMKIADGRTAPVLIRAPVSLGGN